jgi:hypothetical protein
MSPRYEVTDTHGPVRFLAPGVALEAAADDDLTPLACLVLGQPDATALVVAGSPNELGGYVTRITDTLTGEATVTLPAAALISLLTRMGANPGVALRAVTGADQPGFPDPTPGDHSDPLCGHPCHPHGSCTWREYHDGQHVAGNGDLIVGVADPAHPALS